MGKLGTLFGKTWELFVKSPAEALHAINMNTNGGLFKYLSGPGGKKYYKIGVQSKDNLIKPKEELNYPVGQSDIYIMPTIKGAGGNNGIGQAILGVVLIAVGYVLTVYTGYDYGLYAAGIGMIIGGVIQLLTPVPSIDTSTGSDDDGRRSSFFEGNATAISQGGSVGIVYGKSMVSPMPISLAVKNKDNASVGANVGTVGCVVTNSVGGGSTSGGPILRQYSRCTNS